MTNIFDIANVDLFLKKCEDMSVLGSWNRIKADLNNVAIAGCPECGAVAGHWFNCSKLNEANAENTDKTNVPKETL